MLIGIPSYVVPPLRVEVGSADLFCRSGSGSAALLIDVERTGAGATLLIVGLI